MTLLTSPEQPLSLDDVLERWPRIRQSWLAKFDDCALASYFELRYQAGAWTAVEAAIGTMLHRVFDECLREIREGDSEEIPSGIALAILEEKLEQRGIAAEERVRIPMREIPNLRWITAKFANDNSFSARRILDVERELSATLSYTDDEGQIRERELTGTPDALLLDPEDDACAILIDWKTGWKAPPRRRRRTSPG